MAKVNMMQLREDPPNVARMYWGVGVDGAEFYMPVTLAPNETICAECEGSGRDPIYDYRCMKCAGAGTIITAVEEDE